MAMRTVAAGQFKQTCLRLLTEVQETGEPILVTKRGRPIAQLVPVARTQKEDWGQSLRGSCRVVGDIVAPGLDPAEWEALRG